MFGTTADPCPDREFKSLRKKSSIVMGFRSSKGLFVQDISINIATFLYLAV